MSDPSVERRRFRPVVEARAGDRAVAILRELETHRTDEPEIGPMASRLVARVFDIFLAALVIWAVVWLVDLAWFVVFVRDSEEYANRYANPTPPDVPFWLRAVAPFAVLAVLVAYEMVATRFFEATVGKRMLGLRIVSADGRSRAPRLAVAWRSALWAGVFVAIMVVPFAPPIARASFAALVALFVVAARDRLNRAFDDRLSGTRVVRPR